MAAVASVGVGDGVWIVWVAAQLAAIVALAVIQLRSIRGIRIVGAAVGVATAVLTVRIVGAIGVVLTPGAIWIRGRFGSVRIGTVVADIRLGRGCSADSGQQSDGKDSSFHVFPPDGAWLVGAANAALCGKFGAQRKICPTAAPCYAILLAPSFFMLFKHHLANPPN